VIGLRYQLTMGTAHAYLDLKVFWFCLLTHLSNNCL